MKILILPVKFVLMFGLYIHIPFCKQACHYCDFHFTTNAKYHQRMVDAICKEIRLQQNFLPKNELATIYFGGGTPSLLQFSAIEQILIAVRNTFSINENAEVTLEANPDDISLDKLSKWSDLGINRLSVGVQTFQPDLLKWMNRAHSAKEATQALNMIKSSAIDFFTADLIYGYPGSTMELLETDIQKLVDFNPDHISAYHLTIEENTAFGVQKRKGKLKELEEEKAAAQFTHLIDSLADKGYEQYEISNFAKDKQYAKHNTAYWQGIPYLGVGPSAHSFIGKCRQHNIYHNVNYMKSIEDGVVPAEIEFLSREDQINEYLMTALRTKWGINLDNLKQTFTYNLWQQNEKKIQRWLDQQLCEITNQHLILTKKGRLLADELSADLFIV